MIRALTKGAMLAVFGCTERSTRLYRTMTREWMGSQATHVDKLKRVWPGYVEVWREAGVSLPGSEVWIHEGGWTPFPFLANYLLTGKAGSVTNVEGRMLDRYLARAVNGALDCDLPRELAGEERRQDLEGLRWSSSVGEAIAAIGGCLHESVETDRIPIRSESVDLCHSGGALEHYTTAELASFLTEAYRCLRPGGFMSHVFDHRSHLHHADASWPFLAHYGRAEWVYRALCSGPLLHHDRLLPHQVMAAFRRAGFESVRVRRMTLPSKQYSDEGQSLSAERMGISRSKLASRFKEASDDDLRTAAAHYLFRKPGGGAQQGC